MLVNKRLIILVISALILSFLMNQVINLAQAGMGSSLQAGEAEQSAATPAATTAETATKYHQPEKMLERAYEGGEGPLLGQQERSLLLDVVFSLVVAAVVFFLVEHTRLK